jgi:ribosomal protein S27AE
VWGWVHFETVPGQIDHYRTYVFGFAAQEFGVESWIGFVIFHGLVWSSILVILGVVAAFRRRMIDHGAVAVQQFGEDILPLFLLFAISVTGLMLTASYTWMRGYAYDFLAILHAITVIITLLWLPFGKFFHIFQRPAQLGVSFYKDAGRDAEQAQCRRCGEEYASVLMVRDLMTVEKELGFSYEMDGGEAEHYQQMCPKCRRALFGLAQGALWQRHLNE